MWHWRWWRHVTPWSATKRSFPWKIFFQWLTLRYWPRISHEFCTTSYEDLPFYFHVVHTKHHKALDERALSSNVTKIRLNNETIWNIMKLLDVRWLDEMWFCALSVSEVQSSPAEILWRRGDPHGTPCSVDAGTPGLQAAREPRGVRPKPLITPTTTKPWKVDKGRTIGIIRSGRW